jgi:ubiquinone/menaquinone biosynthesis C-methylase UbiE
VSEAQHTDYERNAYNSKLFAQRHWHRKRLEETLKVLGSAGRLLDLGCGSALLIERADCKAAFGVDADKETLILNKKLSFNKKVFFTVADVTALPFKENAFEAVTSTEVIEHLSRPELLVEEMQRVLMEGGKAVITTPNYFSVWPMVEKIWSSFPSARNYLECHETHFVASGLRKLLESNGFRIKYLKTEMALVMLNGVMEPLLGWLDHLLARAGFGIEIIVLAEKNSSPANAVTARPQSSKT